MQPSAFISYSHQDQKWLERLNQMLVPLGRVGLAIWSDQRIRPGDDWRQAIEDELAKATVAILLVSPAFIASEFIDKNELPPLLAAAGQRGLRVLWIPVSTCLHEKTPIATYQAVRPPHQPLDSLKRSSDINKALKAIALEIEQALAPPSAEPPHAAPGPQRSSFGSHLAGLSPEMNPRPLAALRKRFSQLPMPRVTAALHQAIARCHPGQTLASRYPDCPAHGGANGWDALEAYFGDGKGITDDLLLAWQHALEDPAAGPGQVAPAARSTKTLALVVHWDGYQIPQGLECFYSTYMVDPVTKAYSPMAFSGVINLDGRDRKAAVVAIGSVVDTLLMACRDERVKPSVELFVPWWLLAGDWSGEVVVRDEFNDAVSLLGHVPFVIRSADRLRMANMEDLEAKITPLQAGQGQWLPEVTAMDPDRLAVVHTQASMVALRCVAPPAGRGVEERWLKALLKSMVPLALWSTAENALPDEAFHGCLHSLGLSAKGKDGKPWNAPPICPDLTAVPHHRYQAQAHNQQLSRLHLLLDTPLQPKIPRPAQSPT
ncbi:MAG: toll/interleukin-1 receptor domain-containing protein [Cyanobacteriota bacterium]